MEPGDELGHEIGQANRQGQTHNVAVTRQFCTVRDFHHKPRGAARTRHCPRVGNVMEWTRHKIMQTAFDFDFWADLAKRDPEGFFRMRDAAIRALIASRPEHAARGMQLQASIDAMRATAGSPNAALRGIFGMLGEYLAALGNSLEAVAGEARKLEQLRTQLSK